MFALAIMLALASTIIEMSLAAKFPVWRRAAKKNKTINMCVKDKVFEKLKNPY